MSIDCGSQVTVCPFPIHFDTYRGCSHGCLYCFARMKQDLSDISVKNSTESLKRFINGKRTLNTNWCDYRIPLHWGGLSDPFQPLEKKGRASLEALELFAKTGYPFIVSTKGRLVAEEPYLSLIERCNCVVQVSMACSSYDEMEPGAPSFDERVEMGRKIASRGKRVIARVQPYITGCRDEIAGGFERLREAGFHGVTLEGMKFKVKKKGLVKVGGDWCYPEGLLERHYGYLRDKAHEAGLSFYCAENRLRGMGDSPYCCGCDGLDGFEGNLFNAVELQNGSDVRPTQKMEETGTAGAFQSLYQTGPQSIRLKKTSFADEMLRCSKRGVA